jgi:hypothetical protein
MLLKIDPPPCLARHVWSSQSSAAAPKIATSSPSPTIWMVTLLWPWTLAAADSDGSPESRSLNPMRSHHNAIFDARGFHYRAKPHTPLGCVTSGACGAHDLACPFG